MSLSKDYLHIIDHIEYILTCSVARLGLVICLTFKIYLSFLWGDLQEEIVDGQVHNLSTLFQEYSFNITKVVRACIISPV